MFNCAMKTQDEKIELNKAFFSIILSKKLEKITLG